jgi:hypothetical protein
MGADRDDRTSAATHCDCRSAQRIDAYPDTHTSHRAHGTQVPDTDHDAVADCDAYDHCNHDDEPKVHGYTKQNTVAYQHCPRISNGYPDCVVDCYTPSNTHQAPQQYGHTNEYEYCYGDYRCQQCHPDCDGNGTAAVAHSDPDEHGNPYPNATSAGHQEHAV